MAGTTGLELATFAVTVQQPEVTDCNSTGPIATLGALKHSRELLLHPNCTQIFATHSTSLQISLLSRRSMKMYFYGLRLIRL